MIYSIKNVIALFRFSKKEYLDTLIKGKLHISTSETMREEEKPGCGDINESAIISHKSNSKHRSILKNVKIGNHTLNKESLISFTMQTPIVFGDYKVTDCYIQSWFALFNPLTENEAKQQSENLDRMIKEFGTDFVYIDSRASLDSYINKIKLKTNLNVVGSLVDYTSDELLVSCMTKLEKFRYQQEFRILIGNCSHTEIVPLEEDIGDLSQEIKTAKEFEKIEMSFGTLDLI